MDAFDKIPINFLQNTSKRIYLVGGTVRDLLAGRTPADIDLVVEGNASPIVKQIAHKISGKIIDLGKNGFFVQRVASPNLTVDISPLTASSIEDDLRQRDFTINAMAYDLTRQQLIDCLDGQTDLREKKIRLVSATAFKNDPARLVRAYRMASMLDFSIADSTTEAIRKDKDLIATVSGERVWAELFKIFNTSDSVLYIRAMASSGLLTSIFPELRLAIGCTQNRYHQFDVFDHSLLVYEHLEALLTRKWLQFPKQTRLLESGNLFSHSAILKYSALLHDVGKPSARMKGVNGSLRFPGHAAKGAVIVSTISRRLKLSNRQRQAADAIIRHHIRPLFLFLAHEQGTLGRSGMVRFFRHCGEWTLPVIVHAMADIRAKKECKAWRAHYV